jgi:hypothetical protein
MKIIIPKKVNSKLDKFDSFKAKASQKSRVREMFKISSQKDIQGLQSSLPRPELEELSSNFAKKPVEFSADKFKGTRKFNP